MAFGADTNNIPTGVKQGDLYGGLLTLTAGTAWHRIMPDGDNAGLVPGNDRQLNIGTLRSDIDDVLGWNLLIMNTGYHQERTIDAFSGGIATLNKEISYPEGLASLGANTIEYVIFPTIDVALGIIYRPNAESDTIEIGFAKDNIFAPTPKPRDVLGAKEMTIMPTRQIQKIFYRNASASDRISWGEHYTA